MCGVNSGGDCDACSAEIELGILVATLVSMGTRYGQHCGNCVCFQPKYCSITGCTPGPPAGASRTCNKKAHRGPRSQRMAQTWTPSSFIWACMSFSRLKKSFQLISSTLAHKNALSLKTPSWSVSSKNRSRSNGLACNATGSSCGVALVLRRLPMARIFCVLHVGRRGLSQTVDWSAHVDHFCHDPVVRLVSGMG